MAVLTPLPRFIAFNSLGAPLESGKVYSYIAGTTTPKATYTDQSGSTPNTNPTILDSAGSASIWLSGAYKIDIRDSNDVSLPGYPVDNVIGYNELDWTGLTATIAMLNATDTSTSTITASSYSIALSDRGKTLLCDTTSNAITINLLAAATATNGYEISIKKSNVSPTNFVTIDGNGSETIEGRLTFILYDQNDVVTILCDGNNWRVKSAVIRGNVQYQSTTFSTTISDINKTFVCNASAAYTATLVSAAIAGDGFRQIFKKGADTFNITIDPAGAETIDGQPTYILTTPYQAVSIVSDGTNWLIETGEASAIVSTGDIIFSVAASKAGWVSLNDGTIGSATSAATTRANADTSDLFGFIWDNITDAYCPVSGGRGASAVADFAANKTISLPKAMSRAFGVVGTGAVALTFTADSGTDQLTFPSNMSFHSGTPFQVSNSGGALPAPLAPATTYYTVWISTTVIQVATTLANALAGVAINLTTNGTGTNTATITLSTRSNGQYLGEEYHSLTIEQTPAHTHSYTATTTPVDSASGSASSSAVSVAGTSGSTGGSAPHPNMQPTTFLNAYIKL